MLTIMPNRPVRDQWEFPSKMERHFPIKPGQPKGMTPATYCFSSEFPNIRAKNQFVKNGTTNFGRNIPTEISGPPPDVIPNIPVRRNRNGLFHLNSNRNFRNLWVLPNMPNRPVRDQWEFPSKMERHFPIKPGQPIGMALATVCFP